MTAGPDSPGAGPREYQPATFLRLTSGTATAPSEVAPTESIVAETPIAGMLIRVGTDRPSAATAGPAWPPRRARRRREAGGAGPGHGGGAGRFREASGAARGRRTPTPSTQSEQAEPAAGGQGDQAAGEQDGAVRTGYPPVAGHRA